MYESRVLTPQTLHLDPNTPRYPLPPLQPATNQEQLIEGEIARNSGQWFVAPTSVPPFARRSRKSLPFPDPSGNDQTSRLGQWVFEKGLWLKLYAKPQPLSQYTPEVECSPCGAFTQYARKKLEQELPPARELPFVPF